MFTFTEEFYDVGHEIISQFYRGCGMSEAQCILAHCILTYYSYNCCDPDSARTKPNGRAYLKRLSSITYSYKFDTSSAPTPRSRERKR